MVGRIFLSLSLAIAAASLASAEEIRGIVIIKQKLTRHRVTPSASLYQRGPAVALHADSDPDPLAAERTRVVIYIDGSIASSPVSPIPSIEQKDRRFVPELLAVSVGSTVSFPNLDPIFHNVFSLSKPKSFDLGNYPKDQTRTVTFNRPGIEFINCHLHPNMSATIVVTPNRWHAIPDRDGRFTLRDVPPGTHQVVAWHKAAGPIHASVDVVSGRGASVELFVPVDPESNLKIEARR